MQSGLNGILSPTGSGNHRYRPPGLGAKTRMVQSRLRESLWAKDFGVVADGRVDDTRNLQIAINAAIAQNRPLMLPIGTMKISVELSVPSPVTIIGFGRTRSIISLSNTTQNGFNISAINTGEVYFSEFAITTSVTASAGAGILVDNALGGINYESQFRGMRFSLLFNAMAFQRAAYWVVDDCAFEDCKADHILIRNQVTADAGDSYITNCLFEYFQTVTSVNNLVYWESSGGLKIIGNKFNGGFRSIYFNLASGAGTGSIVVASNSIESFTDTGVFVGAATSAPVLGTLTKLVIAANEIGAFTNGTGIRIFSTSTPTWCKAVTIASNVIATGINGSGTTGQGINIDFAQIVTIVGNTLFGNGGSTVGIILGSNASIVSKVGNTISGFGTALTDASTSPQTETLRGALVAGSSITSTSPSGGMGYATGAGGVVTQATSKGTGVTLNTVTGQITMNSAALAAGATVNFVVTNSSMGATDMVVLNHFSGGVNFGSYLLNARANGAGSFAIDVKNTSAGSLSEAIVLSYAIIKAVTA